MALFKKEAPDNSYLNDERGFVQSASYQQRKAFVENNRDRFGKWNYTGTTAQNEKFRNKLLTEEDLKIKYEGARRGIIDTTRTNLWKLRTEWAMERATDSSRANQKMVLGISKDLNGRILEWGLFGVIFGGPKRQQWLASIESDYPQARGKLLPLIQQGFEDSASEAARSWNPKAFINFMKKMGRSFGAQDEARVRQIVTAPKTIKDRQEAIVETLLVWAVSHVLTGGFSLLLGKIRTPIPLHKADLPSKDAVTQSLHGEWAREQSQAAHNEFWNESEKMRITAWASEKAKGLYGKEAAYVLSAIEEFGAQIDVSSNWITSGVKKGRSKNLQKAQEFWPWDTQKTLASIKFKPGSPEEARRISLLEKLSQTQVTKWLAESGVERSGYTEMLSMMSGCGSEEVFLEKYVLPSEEKYGSNVSYIRKAIHAFYHGGSAPYRDGTRDVPSYKYQAGDQKIIYSLVHSNYTPGVVDMVNAYRGNPEKWKTANDKTTGGGRNVREKTQAYSKDLLKNVDMRSPEAVSQVFRNDSVNGKSIADIYSNNLRSIGGINITPETIANAIKNGQYKHVNGQNTWRNQTRTWVKGFNWEALVFTVRESSGAYRVCAIKKDCTNLIIGEKIPSPENYLDNLPAVVNFRMPLILNFKWSSGKWEKKPEKPGETENPETPGTPVENPPQTPGTPTTPEGPPDIPGTSTSGGTSIPWGTPGTGTLEGGTNTGTTMWPTTTEDFIWPVNPGNNFNR